MNLENKSFSMQRLLHTEGYEIYNKEFKRR